MGAMKDPQSPGGREEGGALNRQSTENFEDNEATVFSMYLSKPIELHQEQALMETMDFGG